MIERYTVVAARIRQEVSAIELVVDRAERGMNAARQSTQDKDLYLDSVALNLHDFYAGIERAFRQIAATIDQSLPSGPEWHRELLQQMGLALPQVRPQVLSATTIRSLDEFLRFRHIVQNIYAFEFDAERVEYLVQRLRPTFEYAKGELLTFSNFLEELADGS